MKVAELNKACQVSLQIDKSPWQQPNIPSDHGGKISKFLKMVNSKLGLRQVFSSGL